ncbi:AMP-binding protein [Arthrobacter sp. Soil763]|uniref:AMP-binding protein n=1 Tax=Arthrobacter sp. Soil763 TaxID=1736402 RepID=UPI0006FE06F8|nr:AMP-binding protein [Arthrobacter sp. Soil763]KRE79478.1 AMP-dependent synthetase [Arthrobacter sp. Soil763]
MTAAPLSLNPALAALAAALRGEGPAVELSAGPDGSPAVAFVDTPGFEDAAVVVRTSGSTGAPKATVLTADALAASSMATAMALKGEGQWLLALPVQFVAGVQVLVRSLFAGTRPWAMDLSGGFTPEAFTAAAQELTDRIRFTSLVPTQLQRLLESPAAPTLAALRRFDAVLLGGAPASAELLAAARNAGVKVVTTYGSAETCGGCVYDGVPLDGVEVRIGPDGRILLGGATVAAGYLGEPGLTEAAFSEDGGTRWYRTNDLGALSADGVLTVHGRADDVVITGGVKVSAAHVQGELERLDGVRAAFVAGVPSAEWGQALAAWVVLTDDSPAAAAAFSGRLAAGNAGGLSGALVPKTVLTAADLLMLPNGKPDRIGMTVRLDARHQGK